MKIRSGFAQIDITPKPGSHKIGWLREVIGDKTLDPICARAAAFESGGEQVGFIQLDLLSVRWTQVDRIRRHISEKYGFPGANIMVAATHNHAGPAMANLGDVRRDEAYIAEFEDKCAACFGAAMDSMSDSQLGFGSAIETGIAFNRRVVMRDGTVKTHGRFSPDALCIEGPDDPEVGVMAARAPDGRLLGCVVNFACHPTHYGPEPVFSAGYPGVLARVMAEQGCPVTLFMNGACGNMHFSNPYNPQASLGMEEIGSRLAGRVSAMLPGLQWKDQVALAAASKTINLPFREPTEEQVKATVFGAQRFIDPAIYDRGMPALLEKIRKCGSNPAEIQAIFMGDHVWVGMPAEFFVELGLRIKEKAWPMRAWVAGHANGMVGYVPTRHAFERGGYETTFAGSSKLAPEAGDMMVAAAGDLVSGRILPPQIRTTTNDG